MDTAIGTAKHDLMVEIEAALGEQASSMDLVELVIRCGWQPRPMPDPDSDYLDGLLADGTHVPIEIRRSRVRWAV